MPLKKVSTSPELQEEQVGTLPVECLQKGADWF